MPRTKGQSDLHHMNAFVHSAFDQDPDGLSIRRPVISGMLIRLTFAISLVSLFAISLLLCLFSLA